MRMLLEVVAPTLTLISVAVVIFQLRAITRQTKKDHERSRREVVLNLQKLWLEYCNDAKPRLIRSLLKSLDEDACKQIWNNEPFSLPEKCKFLLSILLDCNEDKLTCQGKEVMVDGHYAILFRAHLLNYLNLLEVIFTAWHDNIGDKGMIEREFGKNISQDGKVYPLDMMVNSAPAFPSIKKFSVYLRKEHEEPLLAKKPL